MTARAISTATRSARPRCACEQSASAVQRPSMNRCTQLCPVLRPMPYVRLSPARPQQPPGRQSSTNRLRSSTGSVSFQDILEVSPIRPDRRVSCQRGTYSAWPEWHSRPNARLVLHSCDVLREWSSFVQSGCESHAPRR